MVSILERTAQGLPVDRSIHYCIASQGSFRDAIHPRVWDEYADPKTLRTPWPLSATVWKMTFVEPAGRLSNPTLPSAPGDLFQDWME
jgi:hypothetical protein